jgi:hypothetical protein
MGDPECWVHVVLRRSLSPSNATKFNQESLLSVIEVWDNCSEREYIFSRLQHENSPLSLSLLLFSHPRFHYLMFFLLALPIVTPE